MLESGDLRRRRAQERPIDSLEASQGWTSAAFGWPVFGLRPHLRRQFCVTRLKEPDERTRGQRRATGLHFREPRTLAEDREKNRVLFRRAREMARLVHND